MMKKLLAAAVLGLALIGCGTKSGGSENLYSTFGEWAETVKDKEEQPMMVITNGQLYAVAEKENHYYQISGAISDEKVSEMDAVDFMADDYQEQRYAIINDVKVEKTIDFTDRLIPQTELDTFAGKTVKDIIDSGLTNTGWMLFSNEETGKNEGELYFEKDNMEYAAEVQLPDDYNFDSEFSIEQGYALPVVSMRFSAPTYAAIPLS